VVAIDAKRLLGTSHWEAYTHGGRTPAGREATAWAREAESRGAGEILLTSMDRDGTGAGFDCELTGCVADSVRIPVIASGGLASLADVERLLMPDCQRLAGAIAGRALYDGRLDPAEALALIGRAKAPA